MFKKGLLHSFSCTFLVLIVINSAAVAGGFQINMLNTKNTGMAGTATAYAKDGSVVFYNPAAMSFLEHAMVSLGTSVTIPSLSFLSPYTGNYDSKNQWYAPVHIYGTGKVNEKLAVGLSVNTPFKQRTVWEEEWTGRYITIESNLNTYYIQPTVSYSLSEKLSAGGGITIGFGNYFFTKDLPVQGNQGDIRMEMDGSSTGFGFNLGIYYKHSDEFAAGISYRSSVKMKVNGGDATLKNIPASLAALYPSSTGFDTEYTLPSVVSAGIAYNLTKELLLCADINVTFWSSYDSLYFSFNDNPDLSFGSGKFYKDVFAIRIGAQYDLSDNLAVRAGIALDKSPVQDDYVSPENPDADRFMFSLGASVSITENLTLDVAYMLQNIKEREATNPETNFGGNYKSLQNIAGLTLNYKF